MELTRRRQKLVRFPLVTDHYSCVILVRHNKLSEWRSEHGKRVAVMACERCGDAGDAGDPDRDGDQRYRLRIVIAGRPVSSNHAYTPITRRGKQVPGVRVLTQAALDWRDAVADSVRQQYLIARALDDLPPVTSWPRPLRLSLYYRHCKMDLDNSLKVTVDGIKRGLGVDDRYFVYGAIDHDPDQGRFPGTPYHQGLRLLVESAPLPPLAPDQSPTVVPPVEPVFPVKPDSKKRRPYRQVKRRSMPETSLSSDEN